MQEDGEEQGAEGQARGDEDREGEDAEDATEGEEKRGASERAEVGVRGDAELGVGHEGDFLSAGDALGAALKNFFSLVFEFGRFADAPSFFSIFTVLESNELCVLTPGSDVTWVETF